MEHLTLDQLEKQAKEKEKNYRRVGDDYLCKSCGSEIQAVDVIFSIHDGPFAMSGSGRTTHQHFPYCPHCETRPEIHGLPIKI